MSIVKDLPELVNANIISQETAMQIGAYYEKIEGQNAQNKLYIVTGILGAILTGLGIILIIAHNWDQFSRFAKTVFAFLPLVIGQLLCIYTLLKKQSNIAWRESASAFLFFSVGASISLVSQIYNIPGGTGTFMLSWMLLCLPVIYIMGSSITSLMYIAGITYYASITNYGTYNAEPNYYYWPLLFLVLPHYVVLLKNKPQSNFTIFHNWIIPLCVTLSLGTIARDNSNLMFVAYISLFGLFYLIGNTSLFKKQKAGNQGYLTIGTIGTICLLLALSFEWFWSDHRSEKYVFTKLIIAPEFIAGICLTAAALALFFWQIKSRPWSDIKPIEPVFIFFILIFIIGMVSSVAVVLINLLILAIGLLIIRNGARIDHLGVLNFGLIIIAILVLCRFFDTDLSFVLRGLLFIGVGIGFFAVNLRMIKKRKVNA